MITSYRAGLKGRPTSPVLLHGPERSCQRLSVGRRPPTSGAGLRDTCAMVGNGSGIDSEEREGFVTVNGVPYFFRMIGRGEPFVVLHGGPGMWHDELFPFFDDLATDHQ